MSVHTLSNPFVPRASVIRFPNGIFEIRVHIQGVASDVQLVPHDGYVLITGRVAPRARIDANGTTSKILWTDYPCGYFGRDIQLRVGPNTEIVVLERRQECDDLLIRYTLRPRLGVSCGVVYPQLDAYSAGGKAYISNAYAHQPFATYNSGLSYDPCATGAAAYVSQPYGYGRSATYVNQPVYGPLNSGVYTVPTPVPAAVGVGVGVGANGFAEGNAHLGGHVGLHAGPINVDVGGGVSGHVDAGVSLKEGALVSI
ncbi:hypothetical protein Clacol_007398 [Clathrus columnatus]|uniref:Galectin n=1 Tax=Clathrus columnatus TaxID=1419009 RepID=A0AAV5AHD3_9AGAM|nr:hypothetical protein Clacol_007398 [Clathrus columnatus]